MKIIIELNETITLKELTQLQEGLKESGVLGELVKYKEENFILELSFNQDISVDTLLNIVGDNGNLMLKKSNLNDILEKITSSNPFSTMTSDLEKMGLVKKDE
jgi:hypothetical protein